MGLKRLKEITLSGNTDLYIELATFLFAHSYFGPLLELFNQTQEIMILKQENNQFIRELLINIHVIMKIYYDSVGTEHFNNNLIGIRPVLLKIKDILIDVNNFMQKSKNPKILEVLDGCEQLLWLFLMTMDFKLHLKSNNFSIYNPSDKLNHYSMDKQRLSIKDDSKQEPILVDFEKALNTILIFKDIKFMEYPYDIDFYDFIEDIYENDDTETTLVGNYSDGESFYKVILKK